MENNKKTLLNGTAPFKEIKIDDIEISIFYRLTDVLKESYLFQMLDLKTEETLNLEFCNYLFSGSGENELNEIMKHEPKSFSEFFSIGRDLSAKKNELVVDSFVESAIKIFRITYPHK